MKPIDEFDRSCQQHDAAYAQGGDLLDADLDFAITNLTSFNPKRMFAGALVGSQGVLRAAGLLSQGHDKGHLSPNTFITPEKVSVLDMPKRKANINKAIALRSAEYALRNPTPRVREEDMLRLEAEMQLLRAQLGQKARKMASGVKNRAKRLFTTGKVAPLSVSSAPVSIGTTMAASKPTTVPIKDGVRASGREFLVSVQQANSTNFQIGALAPLHPAYYPASVMGSLARTYQEYRFTKVAIHFVTKQPTSTNGEVLIDYSPNVLEPLENGASSQFLARAMTRGKAILGPIWTNHSIVVDTDTTWRKVDAFNSTVFNDNVLGEVQVYTLTSTADTSGYLLIDYELEFRHTMFSPHSSILPISFGAGAAYTLNNSVATVVGNAFLATAGNITSSSNGSIWRFICDIDQSTASVGNYTNQFQTTIEWNSSNASTVNSVSNTTALVDGTALYLLVIGSTVAVYASYEAALIGDSSGQFYYNQASSTIVLNGTAYLVRFGPRDLITAN